jgi:hypothetical protein
VFWPGEALNDLPLAMITNLTIAIERREHALMPEILTPRLELLADREKECGEGLAELGGSSR